MLTEQQMRDAWMSLPRGPVLTEEGMERVAAFVDVLDMDWRDRCLTGPHGSFECHEDVV